MAFAKLSGGLLARKDARAATTIECLVSVPVDADSEVPAATPAPSVIDNEPAKLLERVLKTLKLPGFLSEYDKLAQQCAAEGVDHSAFLLRLAEAELRERKRQTVARRVKQAGFPAVKEFESFDFAAVPSLDKERLLDLARCDFVGRRENVIIVGSSGTGKTHIALALGLEACRHGFSVGFVPALSLAHQLIEARDGQRIVRLQQRLTRYKMLIIDELGYVPLPPDGAALMFDVISRRYERGSTIITSSLALDQWAGVFGTAQLTGAAVGRLVQYGHVLEMHGESYRLRHKTLR